MTIIKRRQAIELGLKKYFTGKICPNGHICERYITSTCVECARSRSRLQRKNKQAYCKNYQKEYRIKRSKNKSNYFTGIPCKRGHVCERTWTGDCAECVRFRGKSERKIIYDKKWKHSKTGKLSIKRAQKKYASTDNGKAVRRKSGIKYERSLKGIETQRQRLARRRIRIYGGKYRPYTVAEKLKRFEMFNNSCAYCGDNKSVTIDHFIPISKKGHHCLENIIPACLICNSRKNNRNAETWYKQQKFYSKRRWNKIIKVIGK